jgi:hypothetical protein
MIMFDEAEDVVRLWGTRAGFVVNPVYRDRSGWDQLFEIALPRSGVLGPLHPDIPTAITCRVQIKAISGSRSSVPIKLSNWKRAVEDPLPWFFLLFRIDPQGDYQAVLVHLNKSLMDKVIKRLYKLPPHARSRLHRQTLNVRWRDGIRLSHPVEMSLREQMTAAVGADGMAYALCKQKWYEEAGLPCPRELNICMTFGPHPPGVFARQMAQAIVGLRSLEASDVRITQERFDRPQILAMSPQLTATVTWSDSVACDAILNVSSEDGSQLGALPVRMRSSVPAATCLREPLLIRLQSLLTDMLLDVGSHRLRLNLVELADDRHISIQKLSDNLAFLKCLDDQQGRKLLLSLTRGDRLINLAEVIPGLRLSRHRYSLATDAISLWSLICQVGAADSNMQLNTRQVSELAGAARVMSMSRSAAHADFHLDIGIAPGEIDFNAQLALVTNPYVKLGGVTFMDVVVLIASPTPLPPRNGSHWMRLVPTQCRRLVTRRFVGDKAPHWPSLPALTDLEKSLAAEGLHKVIGVDWSSCCSSAPR